MPSVFFGGIGFTLEPDFGFHDIIHISGVGPRRNIGQGTVSTDEFFIYKPTLAQDKKAIIQKKLGTEEQTLVYDNSPDDISAI